MSIKSCLTCLLSLLLLSPFLNARPSPPPKESSSMIIRVSTELVKLGENVTVRGILSTGLDVAVRLRFTCPNGSEVSVSVPMLYGAFNYVFTPDAPGYWSIRAVWEGNAQYYGCLSNTVGIVVRSPVSLQIIVAPSIIGVGGTLLIYASSTPSLVNRFLTISYIVNRTNVWRTIGTFETGQRGFVACVFAPSETGEYRFSVEWVGDPAYMPSSAESSKVLVTAEPTTPEAIINMMSQLKALQKLLEEKEGELKNYRDAIAGLQRDIGDLQAELSVAESRISSLESQLSETRSRLAEAESRVQFTSILGLVAGVLIGLIIGYLAFRRRPGAGRFPLPPE